MSYESLESFTRIVELLRRCPDEATFVEAARKAMIPPVLARTAAVYACESASNQFPVNVCVLYLVHTVEFMFKPKDTPADVRLMYQSFVTKVLRSFFVHGYCAVTVTMQGSTEKDGYFPTVVDPYLYIPATAQEMIEAVGTNAMQNDIRKIKYPSADDYLKTLRRHLGGAAYIGEDLFPLFHDTVYMQQIMEKKLYRPIVFKAPNYIPTPSGFPSSRVGGLLHSLDIYMAAHVNMRPSNVLVFAPSGQEEPRTLSASAILQLGVAREREAIANMSMEQFERSVAASSKTINLMDEHGQSRGISIINVPVDSASAKLAYVVPDQGAMSRNITKLFEQILMGMGIPPGSFDTRGHAGSEMELNSQTYLRRLSEDIMECIIDTLKRTNNNRKVNLPECSLSVYIKPFALRELAAVQGTRTGEEASRAWGHEGAVDPYNPDREEPPRKRRKVVQ